MAHFRNLSIGSVWMAVSLLGVCAAHSTPAAEVDAQAARSGRIMKLLTDPSVVRMRARADHFPSVLSAPPPPPHRLPIVFTKHTHAAARPQMMRRVQNNVPPPSGPPPSPHRPPQMHLQLQRYSYEGAKSSRYSPSKGQGPFGAPPSGKGGPYRPQFAGAHPNALSPQAQQHGGQMQQQFKASPHYNGEAIVRPAVDSRPHLPHMQQQQPTFQYQPVPQYPIPEPDTEQREQFQQQQRQQQQYTGSRYQSQHSPHPFQQTQFKSQSQSPSQQSPHFAEHAEREHAAHPHPASHTYSVYEDDAEATGERVQAPANYEQNVETAAAQDAQDYLRFMGSNEYFLPKRDPNYKKLDADQDQRQYQQQQLVQHQQQQIQYGKSLAATPPSAAAAPTATTRAHGPSGGAQLSPAYKQPIKVSQLFYHADPAPAATVVRGSYQAGNNVFVVSSDGNKAVKHVVPHAAKVTPLPTYTQLRHRDRTPEPLRFEFTERDAVPASYTNSPIGHLKYKAVGGVSAATAPTSSTTAATTTSRTAGNPQIQEPDNDPEDGEDMQEASSDVYGRVPVRVAVGPSTEAPTEQKDTEDYCERICANVQDDDEEIVCGSDGYMYTSEAQMECYASCLHIDVTIQSKGSCSAS